MAKQVRKSTGPTTTTPTRTRPDPAAELLVKYTAYGWTISSRPRGNINDFVAAKADRMHFIQLITPDDTRTSGERRSTFIQNAFSNDATPVYAEISARGLSLSDANTGSRVGLGRIGGAAIQKQPGGTAKNI